MTIQFNGGTPMLGDFFAVTSDAVASPVFTNGLAYRQDGQLYIDSVAPIAIYNSGLPQTASGALATTLGGVVASHTSSGIPLTAAGRVAISTGVVPSRSGFSNGFSDGFGGTP
jgi:hypothetical protein